MHAVRLSLVNLTNVASHKFFYSPLLLRPPASSQRAHSHLCLPAHSSSVVKLFKSGSCQTGLSEAGENCAVCLPLHVNPIKIILFALIFFVVQFMCTHKWVLTLWHRGSFLFKKLKLQRGRYFDLKQIMHLLPNIFIRDFKLYHFDVFQCIFKIQWNRQWCG